MNRRSGNAGRAVVALAAMALGGGPARAAGLPPSLQDEFRLGSGSGVLCRAATVSAAPASGMFDRGYAILCRDAAAAVGHLYALRANPADAARRLDAARGPDTACGPDTPATVGALAATVRDCRVKAQGVGFRAYRVTRGRVTYAAEGLQGYDSALKLGLQTLVLDRPVPGTIEAATTSVANPAAFARVQAGTLDPTQLLAEGYRRNNSGSYADAAEFFDAATERDRSPEMRALLGEYVANRALQRSNLGEFAQADALFAQLSRLPTTDPVQLRIRRNFLALHLLNQGRFDEASAELAQPLAAVPANITTPTGAPVIDATVADQLNADAGGALTGAESASLTPAERAEVLDAQATGISGTIHRLQGDVPGAEALLTRSLAELQSVREGRVTALTRLRAQTMGELSACAEARGDRAAADRLLRDALAMVSIQYPGSAAERLAQARLAGFLARQGQDQAAIALFRQVVAGVTAGDGGAAGLQGLLSPYFALLARDMGRNPALAADFFAASQTLVRPGVADTQAVLARELSGGADEASRLFRQAVALSREVERDRTEVARLEALPTPTPDSAAALDTARAALARAQADQVATQASLAAFPRYRAVAGGAMTLADLQATLTDGEGYYKLAVVGPTLYGLWVTRTGATAFPLAVDAAALDEAVTAIRDTITKDVGGTAQTQPFDVDRARALYVALFGPVADQVAASRHLVFEPDGAMLRLPASLLVTDDASAKAYDARANDPKGDPFDFRGVAWLGRHTDVSTAVSPRAFRDLRAVAPSAARFGYLGLGENQPVQGSAAVAVARTRAVSARGALDCNWPLSAWSDPIQPTELFAARRAVGGGGDEVVTGAAFSDTALIERHDLADYRIVHFATHGLVTAPRPECPARPALLTSFGAPLPGGQASDGLLSFREVFDLRLDADLVILSACDTAGAATAAATREAGEVSGGGTALDGLVRAFVGAGGRAVLASHWPVPNDYRATERLITGLFQAPRGTGIGDAMRASELKLMDDKDTSHPYYWAAFALVGDGARPLLRADAPPPKPSGTTAAAVAAAAIPGS